MARLAAFDFDHTIIDDNSDATVMKMLPKIPQEVKAIHSSDGWTLFMQSIFRLLHKHKRGETFVDAVAKLSPVCGMVELICAMKQLNYDIIIISDSNYLFIDLWLQEHGLKDKILQVFSNPARFIDGVLTIEMYHVQDNCKLSTKNLCKGQILDDFIKYQKEKGINYEKIVYCGDGQNDFCPILRLNENDLACVRNNYKCSDLVRKAFSGELKDDTGEIYTIKADVFTWNNGLEILKKIQTI